MRINHSRFFYCEHQKIYITFEIYHINMTNLNFFIVEFVQNHFKIQSICSKGKYIKSNGTDLKWRMVWLGNVLGALKSTYNYYGGHFSQRDSLVFPRHDNLASITPNDLVVSITFRVRLCMQMLLKGSAPEQTACLKSIYSRKPFADTTRGYICRI